MEAKPDVLIVDDEVNILNALKRAFAMEEFTFYATADIDEALRIAEAGHVKVILSDHRMPKMEGAELLSRIRIMRPETIRILFTGYADIKAAEDAINKGEVYRFVTKPWDDYSLIALVREAIQRYDMTEENKRLYKMTRTQNDELERMNVQLKALYEKEKNFSSTVSHELRTPLAAIKMAVDIVVRESKENLNDDARSYLEIAKSNVDRLALLINDILDLTKLEMGKTTFDLKPQHPSDLLWETYLAHKPVAEAKGLSLRMTSASPQLVASLDRNRIQQVLINLINNAIKFTDHGGITLSLDYLQEKKAVKICVADTGKGIAAEDIPKLFHKFQQLGTAELQVEGTGLGLAISKEIIRQHGGEIWAESDGSGSRFCFTLPVTPENSIQEEKRHE